MTSLLSFYQSSIGKKIVVAVTGFLLILFVIGHIAGNLTIYAGPDALNAYAKGLHDLGPLLWAARAGLLVVFALHLVATIQLSLANYAAKGDYEVYNTVQATKASRSMIISGGIILLFIIFHLLHFTFFAVDSSYADLRDPEGRHDVYTMVILGFQNPLIAGFYVVALFLLFMHLSHGFASIFQTLGFNSQRSGIFFNRFGYVFAWAIFLAYISIPVSVLAGLLQLPEYAS